VLEDLETMCVHQVSGASQRLFNELIISLYSSQTKTHSTQQHSAAGWNSMYTIIILLTNSQIMKAAATVISPAYLMLGH